MLKFWLKTLAITLVFSVFWGVLIGLDRGFNIYLPNRLFATMAFFMIALSLGAASFVYFTKKLPILLSFRMYFGITGFVFAVLHAMSSLSLYFLFNADKQFYQFDKNWPIFGNLIVPNSFAYFLGETALIMFAFMAIITMKKFVVKLGGMLWRELLRVIGYVAFVLVLTHFLIKDFYIWTNLEEWSAKSDFIPTNLLLFIIGISILILRIGLQIELNKKKKPV